MLSRVVAAAGVIAALILVGSPLLHAKGKGGGMGEAGSAADAPPIGSVRPAGKLNATGRLALARISFQRACNTALTVRPGRLIYGELEVDDGNLDFDFEIVGSGGNVIEVQIDAGNGRVLDIDDNADNV
jgi:hypothetical protein